MQSSLLGVLQVRLVGDSGEMRTQNLPNANLERLNRPDNASCKEDGM
jgi:hypothetical protein